MNWSALNDLLERYYDGQTTAAEESKILEMLSREDLPGEFADDKLLIGGLLDAVDIPEPPGDLDEKIMKKIDEAEQNTRIISLKRRVYAAVSVAATALIVISFWFIIGDNSGLKDTYSDPQLAYNETVEVLMIVSRNLNKGTEQMEELSVLNETKEKLSILPKSRKTVAEELEPLKYIENSVDLINDLTNNDK